MKQRLLNTLRSEETFLAALATTGQDGRPRVRYVIAQIDDELTIRCPTFHSTEKVTHIETQPEVHLTCGDVDSSKPGSYFQIEGLASIERGIEERELAWTARLEKWFSGVADDNFTVVKIVPYRIVALPIGGGPAPERWERS